LVDTIPYTELSQYAIKEFKAGALNYWVYVHNKIVELGSLPKAIDAIRRNYRKPALVGSSLEAISLVGSGMRVNLKSLVVEYGSAADLKGVEADLYRSAIHRRIRGAWRTRNRVAKSSVGQLDCYQEAAPFLDRHGRIDLEPRTCTGKRCAVASGMAAEPKKILALVAEIDSQPTSNENKRRRKALRQLSRTPKRAVDESTCRSLGDAVFAFYAPDDTVILTTNLRDHVPLARALGKRAVSPSEFIDDDSSA